MISHTLFSALLASNGFYLILTWPNIKQQQQKKPPKTPPKNKQFFPHLHHHSIHSQTLITYYSVAHLLLPELIFTLCYWAYKMSPATMYWGLVNMLHVRGPLTANRFLV